MEANTVLENVILTLQQPTHWHWFIASVIFIIFEIILPTSYLLWTGIGAFVVGIILYFVPDISWQMQLILFAVLSIVSILVGRSYLIRKPLETDEPLLNRRGEQYIGRIVTLDQAIVNGVGHVSLDDTRWRIEGKDTEAGEKVKVTGVDGTSLVVEEFTG